MWRKDACNRIKVCFCKASYAQAWTHMCTDGGNPPSESRRSKPSSRCNPARIKRASVGLLCFQLDVATPEQSPVTTNSAVILAEDTCASPQLLKDGAGTRGRRANIYCSDEWKMTFCRSIRQVWSVLQLVRGDESDAGVVPGQCQHKLNHWRLSDSPNHRQQQATHPESGRAGMLFIWFPFHPLQTRRWIGSSAARLADFFINLVLTGPSGTVGILALSATGRLTQPAFALKLMIN